MKAMFTMSQETGIHLAHNESDRDGVSFTHVKTSLRPAIYFAPKSNHLTFAVSHWAVPQVTDEITLSNETMKDIRDTLYDLAGKIKQLHNENNLKSLRKNLWKEEGSVKFSEPTSGFEITLSHYGSASLKTRGGTTITVTDRSLVLLEVDGIKHKIRSVRGLMQDGFEMMDKKIRSEARSWIHSF